MSRFVTFGETMVQYNASYIGDFDESGEYIEDCAGAESNVAVNLNKLCVKNLETIWVSRLGNDDAADFILDELRGRTTLEATKNLDEKTGISYLNHLKNGQHVKTYRRKDSAASRLKFQDVKPHIEKATIVHVTGITPALSDTCKTTIEKVLEYTRKHKIPVSFDVNYREQLWETETARTMFEYMLPFAWIFKVGHDEAENVWQMGLSAKEYAKYFHNQNGGLVIITMADKGALVYDGNAIVEENGYEISVVDPVGAGDAFVAGFVGTIIAENDETKSLKRRSSIHSNIIRKSLRVANVCGAVTCTKRGDTTAMPTSQEINDFLTNQSSKSMN